MMKYLLLFLIPLLVGNIGTYFFLTYTSKQAVSKSVTPLPAVNQSAFSVEKAPSASLTGTIASLSGDVLWQSRTATDGAKIMSPVPIHQGESLKTDKNGGVTILLRSCQIALSPSSAINIIQALPTNIVIEQTAGTVSYTNSCGVPVAVRTGNLITQKNSGEINVTIDDENNAIRIANRLSTATVGFNDKRSITTLVSLPEKSTYVFDTETRTGVIKPLPKADY